MKMNRSGFTLIEILVVMGILAVFIFGSIFYGSFINSIKIDGASTKLAADLRYAQSLAMSTTTWYGVSFEVSPVSRYTVYSTTGSTETTIENPARLGTNLIINTKQDYNTDIISVNISGENKIEFSPLGEPYNDKLGSLMATEGNIVLRSGSYTKTIKITPNTGQIFIQ